MTRKHIFVIDDDPNILRLIAANFDARGLGVSTFSNGAAALAALQQSVPDLVILDIKMPGIDGIELVRRIRGISGIPVLMVSARAEEASKLEALNLGADDYLTKPFSIEELLARVRAILRRFDGLGPDEMTGGYQCDSLDVDLDRVQIAQSGRPVKLSAREWAVLRMLIKYVGRVVTHRMLLQQVWGPEYGDEGDYVRTYINRLRKKLEPESQNPRYILTERGIGYRLFNPRADSDRRHTLAS